VVSNEPYVATLATVSPIGTTFWHHGFATERHTSGSAITTTEINGTFVDELALAHQISLVAQR